MSLPATWTTSCPDWANRIVKRESLIALPPLFPESAKWGLQYFHELKAVDVANSPYFGEISPPWINDFVGSIFGSYNPDTKRRHIKEFFLLISKKNGKSTIAAGIMLVALLQNWRQDAEFLILAPTKEVADNSFKPAASAIRADPELSDLLLVQDHTRTITHRETNATLKVVAADSATVSGKKAVGVLIDELHEFGKVANAESMINEATGGLMSRPEGFIIYLSTQGSAPPAGIFKKKLHYARQVRDGSIQDPQFLPVLYEFPEAMIKDESYMDPSNYYVTNPNLGLSVDEETLQRKLRNAGTDGEDSLQDVLAKHLNVEIGQNLLADRWGGADHWQAAGIIPVLTLKELLRRCEVVTIGGDGGGLDDLLGMCVLGRERDTGRWLAWFRAWAHPIVLKRRKKIATVLEDFKNDGDLVIVEHVGEDSAEFGQICQEIEQSGLLFQIGLDANAVGGIMDAIIEGGVPAEKIVSVNQGFRLGGAINTTERKLLEGVLIHAGRPFMAWQVGNAKTVRRGNAIVVTKQVSGSAKIDALIALFNAVALMSLNPPAQNDVVDTSGMMILG